ncbi:MAG TPA: VCBS repeat-containing protein [Planctomycetota bacterium]|nr:VCBS repeat-containing protein [Planctomycetota bacterium]
MSSPILSVAAAFLTVSQGFAQSPLSRLEEPFPELIPEALGDVDGDGDTDVVGFGAVAVNDGYGRFTRREEPTLAFTRSQARLADFDGDGLADLASIGPGGVRIDLSTPSGAFSQATGPVGYASALEFAMDVADVDGDGDLDIVVAQGGSSSTAPSPALLINAGGGVFVWPIPAFPGATSVTASYLHLRDFDGDGDPDLLLGRYGGAPTLFMNGGGGAFVAGPALATAPHLGWACDVGDFDGDGRHDFAITRSTPLAKGLHVYLNGPAGFQAPVVNSGFALFEGWSFGTLTSLDVDGDGNDEIVASDTLSGTHVFDFDSGGTIIGSPAVDFALHAAPWVGTGSCRARDLDGDGDRDLLTVRGDGSPFLRGDVVPVRTRGGEMHPSFGRVIGPAPRRIVVADFDGDGAADLAGPYAVPALVFGAANYGLVFCRGDDGGRFVAASYSGVTTTSSWPANFRWIAFDRDGDGDVDLHAAPPQFPSGSVHHVFDNDGAGGFTEILSPIWGGPYDALAACDYDADGDLDLFLGGTTGAAVGLTFLAVNGGGGVFGVPTQISTGLRMIDLKVGDVDGNGYPDVVELSGTTPTQATITYHLGGPSGVTSVAQNLAVGGPIAVGDLDDDGDDDLVVGAQTFLNAGGVPSLASVSPTTPVNAIDLADLDEDGLLDLVETPATVRTGVPGFAFGAPDAATDVFVPSYLDDWGTRSAVVDVDRDGDLDVVAPGPRVFVNARRQIASRDVVLPGTPATLDLFGAPGGTWWLFASPGVAQIPAPPFGTLLIDPAAAVPVAASVYPASGPSAGAASLTFMAPAGPAFIGLSLYWQAFDGASAKTTNRATTTVTAY